MDTGASHEVLVCCSSVADDAAEDILVAAADGVEVLDGSGKIKTEFKVLPYGTFKLRDGRGPYTIRDQAHAEQIIKATLDHAGAQDLFIDYDHQLLTSAASGGTAEAAGWVKGLEARSDGIYFNPVEWTVDAADKLDKKKYRYFSPLFRATKDGVVTRIINGALVNQPAIDGLGAIAASLNPTKETEMKLTAIAAALGLATPDSATEPQIIAAAQALTGNYAVLRQAVGAKDSDTHEVTVAAAQTLKTAKLVGKDEVAIPASVWNDTQARLGRLEDKDVEDLVAAGVTEGKITPATQPSMLSWAKQDRAAFETYLKNAPVIVAAGQKLAGKPAPANASGLTEVEVAAARSTGLTDEEFVAARERLTGGAA